MCDEAPFEPTWSSLSNVARDTKMAEEVGGGGGGGGGEGREKWER